MIDVGITMNEPVETGSEIYACVIQLGSSSSIECNIAYASATASGEPQRGPRFKRHEQFIKYYNNKRVHMSLN